MYTLSEKARTLTSYPTNPEQYNIRLDANESFIDVTLDLTEKLQKEFTALKLNRYPDANYTRLRKAYADLVGVDMEQVTPGNGSDELLWIIQSIFMLKGESVLIFSPDFAMYDFYANLCELKLLDNPRREGVFQVNEAIELAQKERVRMVLFSNPCNPTSQEIPREEILRLADSLNNCLVVVDEAYMEFGKESVIKDVASRDNLIVLRTCSKAIGAAGLRVGFSITNPNLAKRITAAASPYHINVVSEMLASAILEEKEYIASSVERIIESRDRLQAGLEELSKQKKFKMTKVFKSHTNFVYVRLFGADKVYEELKKRSILVRFFPGHLRITCGTEEENQAIITALDEIL